MNFLTWYLVLGSSYTLLTVVAAFVEIEMFVKEERWYNLIISIMMAIVIWPIMIVMHWANNRLNNIQSMV